MARIKALAEYLLKFTEFLEPGGFDLDDTGQLMNLYALRLQVLLDTAQRATPRR